MPRLPLPKLPKLPKANIKAGLDKVKAAVKSETKLASKDAYNARRRYKRAGERYAKDARKYEGTVYGERLARLSEIAFEQAAKTYADKKEGGYSAFAIQTVKESKGWLAGQSMDEERQADIVMESKIGARIYAGAIEAWEGKDYDEREQALWDAFGVKSNAELLELLERQMGKNLYVTDQPENYDSVVTAIANLIA